MLFEPASIPDVVIITPQVFGDDRGFFMETYQAERFGAAGLPFIYVQDNHSGSQHGSLRIGTAITTLDESERVPIISTKAIQ